MIEKVAIAAAASSASPCDVDDLHTGATCFRATLLGVLVAREIIS